MKVIFTGHFLEQTGSGEASRNYIKAMLAAGIEVAARPILLNSTMPEIEPEIQHCITTEIDGATHNIQHSLPHHYNYDGNYKNIGLFVGETTNIQMCGWYNRLKLMDEIWVPNQQLAQNLRQDMNVKVTPHAFNIEEYHSNVPKQDTFTFYTIGEFIRRKNFHALLTAFHLAFHLNDEVELIIKTSKFNTGNELEQIVRDYCSEIKHEMKLYGNVNLYKQEKIIVDRLSRHQILDLHQSCHCYINSSYGEGWCIPAWEAMAMNNFVISTNEGAPKDFLENYSNGYLVSCREQPCMGMNDPSHFADVNTAWETWRSIDVLELASMMLKVYSKRIPILTTNHHHYWSYENIGNLIRSYL